MPNARKTIPLALAATAVLLATPAGAQRLTTRGVPPEDPIVEWSEQLAPRNEFFINDDRDVEIIRFKGTRDVELCAGAARENAFGKIRGYPIKAMWDNETAVIAPGNCLSFDAQKVSVRAASRLPQDIVLTGTFRVSK